MINPFNDVNWHPGLQERRKFAFSMMVGFPSLATVFSLIARLSTHTWRPFPIWLGVIGLSVGVILWLLPHFAQPLYIFWYALACCMGIVIANLLFCAFYFLILTPLGFCLRTAGSTSFRKGVDRRKSTYWEEVKPVDDAKMYYRQF